MVLRPLILHGKLQGGYFGMHSDKMHSAREKAARERRSPKETALTSTTQPAQVERPQWAPEWVETPEDRGQKDRTLPY